LKRTIVLKPNFLSPCCCCSLAITQPFRSYNTRQLSCN
jgi:hypothetical protein